MMRGPDDAFETAGGIFVAFMIVVALCVVLKVGLL